ncbi:MAG: ChaN family lipoprotein [Myxococcota bacterium]
MRLRPMFPALALIPALLATGCPRAGAPPLTVDSRVRRMVPPQVIVRVADASTVSLEALVADLRSVPITYAGERHDNEADHRMQNLLFRALSDYDARTALGMEMFQRPFQSDLDLWSAGQLDEEALRRRTEWDARWGFDFAFYRPMLELARARNLPVIALNAPRELTRAVGRGGVASLDAETRAELPYLDLGDAAHRAMVEAALGDHGGMSSAQLEHLYEAQVLWDETMAETVAEVMASPHAPGHLLVLAGAFHVRAGLGIPRRAARRGAPEYRIVLVADDVAEANALAEERPRPADYVWVP